MDEQRLDETATAEPTYVAPRNDIESAVAGIWAELLQAGRVGVHDNFLLLGGESLLATQAASRIRRRFGCDVTIRSILVGSVADVAAEVATKAHETT